MRFFYRHLKLIVFLFVMILIGVAPVAGAPVAKMRAGKAPAALSEAEKGARGLPDLTVVSIETTGATNNYDVQVAWQVKNIGDATAPVSWYDQVYFSTDSVLDASDTVLGGVSHSQPALAPGQSYAAAYSGDLPDSVPPLSSYYVLIKTDYYDQVYESNEANNTGGRLMGVPDLFVSSIDTSSVAGTQQPIKVSWTTTNLGDASVPVGWYDYVYLSSDTTLGGTDDKYLGYFLRNQPLGAGQSYAASINTAIPEVASGNYYVLIKTDNYENVYESNEANNVSARPITIGVPDLFVSSIDTSSVAGTQQPIKVSWTTTNLGDASVPVGWYDYVYLSSDTTLGGTDDKYLGYFLRNQPLGAGQSYAASINTAIPEVASGNYYVLIKTDYYDQVYESNEANNVSARPITIGVPDLFVSSIDTSSFAATQQPIKVSWTTTNLGDASIPVGWYDYVYLSSDTTLGGTDDKYLGYFLRNQPLGAGQSYAASINTAIPEVASGNYYVLIKTDYYENVYESNEANNVSAPWPITIAGEPDTTPPTDPVVTSSSHIINKWSNDNTVEANWPAPGQPGGATDNLSGIDGYSISWSQNASQTPDTVKDLEESAVSATSPSLADGTWWFNLRTKDYAGNWTSTAHLGPFKIDRQKPTATVLVPRLSTNESKTTRFMVNWSAADPAPSSGIAGYYVQYKDGPAGAWTDLKLNTTETQTYFSGQEGHMYYFRARAMDGAVNLGNWSQAKATVVPYDDTNASIVYTGVWTLLNDPAQGFYKDTVHYSMTASDTASFSFSGQGVMVVATAGPDRGEADIYIDGIKKAPVDTFAAAVQYRKTVFTSDRLPLGNHILTIVNLATRGRARFDLDGIGVAQ